ncbi:hypothetical protein VNO77_29047 [Canavalia gladiata]|uniref:Transmembrane protein n=1 Tax=Canavalia gladiata TaxID=3824 RepID=A0AAN9Q539_CANGL
MATAFASSSSSPKIATFLSSTFHSNSHTYLSSLRITTLPSTSPFIIPSKKLVLFHNPLRTNNNRLPPILAAAEDVDVLSSEATDQLVFNTDDGGSVVVSALFLLAFIGLSVITIGVIYLGVTDFLQKREKEKFEKEEAAKKSKKKKKKVGRSRAGPRGFGQKVVEYEDED